MNARIRNPTLQARLMTADAAAAFIAAGDTVAMSGFTGAGHPKAVPLALAARMQQAQARGDAYRVRLLTGASTAPELDGALATVDGMELRLPYQSDPTVRERINSGQLDYLDIHLGHVGQQARGGFFGDIDVAVVEIAAVLEDGRLIPSSSVGNIGKDQHSAVGNGVTKARQAGTGDGQSRQSAQQSPEARAVKRGEDERGAAEC